MPETLTADLQSSVGRNVEAAVLIWDLKSSPPDSTAGTVLWRGASLSPDNRCLSIGAWVEKNAANVRQEYLRWLAGLGAMKIRGKTLAENLRLDATTSYWWLTLMSEKCNFTKSPHINDVVKLIALKIWLVENPFSDIKVVTDRKVFKEAIEAWCDQNGYRCLAILECPALEIQNTRKKRRLRKILPRFVHALFWLMLYAVKRWPLKGLGLDKLRACNNTTCFFSYLFNVQKSHLKNPTSASVTSSSWGPLVGLLDTENIKSNWFYLYIPSDSLPDAKSVISCLNRINNQSVHTHLTFDSFLSLGIIYRTLKVWLKLQVTAFKIKKQVFQYEYYGIRFETFFQQEWRDSFYGQHGVNVLLHHFLIGRMLGNLSTGTNIYYLMEDQGWECSLVRQLDSDSVGKVERVVGVPHSTVRFWDLRYFFDRKLFNQRGMDTPGIPDVVAANGANSRAALVDGEWPDDKIANVEALRYLYLNDILSSTQVREIDYDHTHLLVIGDYVREDTNKLIRLLCDSAPLLPCDIKITVKPHPNCPVEKSQFENIEVTISNAAISELLQVNDIAFTGNLTSGAVDAYCAGLQVICMLDDGNLNMSPLRGMDNVQFVTGPDGLAAEVRKCRTELRMGIKSVCNDYFDLDPTLTRWRALLKQASAG
jgi:surface carbohydrate biosynthesis protein (TIGR04326 family)